MTDLPPRSGEDAGDKLLLERARAGDSDAFAGLYEQEVDAARRLARILVGEERSEELVAESFARVLAQLKAGRGPTDDFRAYLHVTIRNGFRDGLRAPRESPSSDQPWLLDDVLPPVEELVADLDRDVAVSALATLPRSWQQVLWHLEVEGRKPAEVAGILGMEAGAVSSLAYRAREGLKRAYLDQHLQPVSGGLCGWTQSRLSQYVRGDLSARAEAKVSAHVDACPACGAALLTVDRVNQKLAAWLFPVVLWGLFGAKKGGLLWLAGAGGAGAAGGSTSGAGSGRSSNPLVLGVAGAVVACGIAGGVALAVTAGGDDPPPRGDTGVDADPGGPGDAAPPAVSTGAPPPDRPSAPPPATTSAPAVGPTAVATSPRSPAATPTDPTPSETSSTTPTSPSSTPPATTTSTATTSPAVPVTGGLVSVAVSQAEPARAVAGRQRLAVARPYVVTVTSRVAGDGNATIRISYTFEDARIVNVVSSSVDGWSCGGPVDLLLPAGQPVTCTFGYVGTSPPPVALEVANVLQPDRPRGIVTMTIDGAPADPGELGF